MLLNGCRTGCASVNVGMQMRAQIASVCQLWSVATSVVGAIWKKEHCHNETCKMMHWGGSKFIFEVIFLQTCPAWGQLVECFCQVMAIHLAVEKITSCVGESLICVCLPNVLLSQFARNNWIAFKVSQYWQEFIYHSLTIVNSYYCFVDACLK